MENEIDNLYPRENSEENIEDEQNQDEKDYYSEVPSNFVYKPIEIPHHVDWFTLLLAWIIIGVLGYVLFK